MRRLFVAFVLLAACRGQSAPAPAANATPPGNAAPPTTTAANAAPAPAVAASAAAPALACAAIQGCVERCRADDRACQHACVARLVPAARPYFDRLQACVEPACASRDGGAAPCLDPASFACKLCAMSHCAQLASACLAH
jgi:hypothetical protein